MTLRIELPHILENEEDFKIVESYYNVTGTEYNKPESYPVAIIGVGYNYHNNGLDEYVFTYLYPNDLKSIIAQNEKFKDYIK